MLLHSWDMLFFFLSAFIISPTTYGAVVGSVLAIKCARVWTNGHHPIAAVVIFFVVSVFLCFLGVRGGIAVADYAIANGLKQPGFFEYWWPFVLASVVFTTGPNLLWAWSESRP